jgi:hypothetical protein
MVYRIEREEMHQQKVWFMLADQIRGSLRPHLIAIQNIGLAEIVDVGRRDHALLDHLARHRVRRHSPFRERPRD